MTSLSNKEANIDVVSKNLILRQERKELLCAVEVLIERLLVFDSELEILDLLFSEKISKKILKKIFDEELIKNSENWDQEF